MLSNGQFPAFLRQTTAPPPAPLNEFNPSQTTTNAEGYINPSILHPTPTYLPSDVPSFRCRNCSLEVALQDELESRAFTASQGGTGFLVRSVINTINGPKKERNLSSGKHTVADLVCFCSTTIGWSYIKAYSSDQKYKEGKHILEQQKIYKDNKWIENEPVSQ